MLAKIAMALALVLGLSTGFFAYRYTSVHSALEASQVALAQAQSDLASSRLLREKEQAVSQAHVETITALRASSRTANANLQKALAANAPWSDQVVPSGVADALRVQRPARN